MLIAIGGTGQHVALACARLVYLKAIPPMECMTIDSDSEGAISVSLKTFGGTVLGTDPESHPLRGAHNIYVPYEIAGTNPQFKDLLLHGSPSSFEADLFELYFDESSATIPVKHGMYGNPSVGATVFAQNAESGLKDVFAQAAGASEIIIAGSFIGGTGAGMMHQFVEKLAQKAQGKPIFGVFFLPWFQPEASAGGGAHVIDKARHNRNMQHGLDYYFHSTRKLMKGCVLLGMPAKGSAKARMNWITPKAGSLAEIPHHLHLVAAWSVYQLPRMSIINNAPGSTISYGFDNEGNGQELMDQKWEKGKLCDLYNRGRYVHRLLELVLSDKIKGAWRDLFADSLLKRKMADKSVMPDGLYKTIELHASINTWRARQDLAEAIFNGLYAVITRLKFCFDWMEHENVLGVQPTDPRVENIKGYAAALEILRNAWVQPIPKGAATALTGSQIAEKLIDMIP